MTTRDSSLPEKIKCCSITSFVRTSLSSFPLLFSLDETIHIQRKLLQGIHELRKNTTPSHSQQSQLKSWERKSTNSTTSTWISRQSWAFFVWPSPVSVGRLVEARDSSQFGMPISNVLPGSVLLATSSCAFSSVMDGSSSLMDSNAMYVTPLFVYFV